MGTIEDIRAVEFEEHRRHLVAVAYRLTGSVADAEDAVQESWLRLAAMSEQARAAIREPRAWLTTVVSRICLDRLRSATVRREQYVGDWLPEPIVTPISGSPAEDPLDAAVRDDGVRMAAMVVLDRLPPEQRVGFVLHDAFSVPFAEIAEILGCTPAAARQYASRGRRAVADADPAPRLPVAEQQAVVERLVAAFLSGDIRAIAEVLHPDVAMIGDSDGKARTTRRTMVGAEKVARFFAGLLARYPHGSFEKAVPMLVNGDLGLYIPEGPPVPGYFTMDAHLQTMAIRDGLVVAIYDQVNPDKLARVPR